jgi:phosphate-selective porin
MIGARRVGDADGVAVRVLVGRAVGDPGREGRDLLHLFTALATRHRTEPLQQLDGRAMADPRPRRTNIR